MTAAAPAGRTTLRAGPLTMLLDDGGLRYVRLGEREILRRVYVAVRDARWATVPMRVVEQTVQAGEDSFAVDLVAEHQQGPIHFRWKGTLRGDAGGAVRLEMDGEALTTFQRNRVGICVLHPIETCAGLACRVRHADGAVEDSAFPRLIAPHQPFLNVRALSYQIEPGMVAEVAFEGDVFETEDQRNWSDHSFKTYSTPIDLPKPVEVRAGTRIRQAVSLGLVPRAIARQAPPASRDTYVELTIGDAAAPLPVLGTTLAPRPAPLTERERDRLAALRLGHLRVELVPSRADFAPTFALAQATAGSLDLPLELAVWVTPAGAGAELEAFARIVRAGQARVSAVQVLPTDRESSPPAALEALRALLPGVRVAAGSNVHFTELNRNRAPAGLADGLLLPNCPTVHMVDDTTVAENLAALTWIAQTARELGGGRPIGFSPIGLRPPPCPPPVLGGEDHAAPPRYVDARQSSLFFAGWVACHIGQAARAGFSSLTYCQTTGWRGLMSGDVGPALPPAFGAEAGAVFPVYHVLADLAELAGAEVLATHSSAPVEVDALAVRLGGRLRVLLANLTGEVHPVHLPAPLAGGLLRRLGLNNVALATRDPEAFRDAPIESIGKSIVLGPHELARIDAGG